MQKLSKRLEHFNVLGLSISTFFEEVQLFQDLEELICPFAEMFLIVIFSLVGVYRRFDFYKIDQL